jgi:hypothetical protein
LELAHHRQPVPLYQERSKVQSIQSLSAQAAAEHVGEPLLVGVAATEVMP